MLYEVITQISSFDITDPSTWPVSYQGDENPTSLEISTGDKIQVNLTGNDLVITSYSIHYTKLYESRPAGSVISLP